MLRVNYLKSNIISINISSNRLNHMASTFQCKADELPFTYLGLPLGLNKPTTQDCLPLVHRVEKSLIITSIFMSQGGKLQLVNLFSSLPTYYMCSIKLPISTINQIDKYKCHNAWRGWGISMQRSNQWLSGS
jgi:hypothetical protein